MYYYDYYNYYYCVRERERERERLLCPREQRTSGDFLLLFPQTSREKVYTSSYARKKKRSLLFSRLLRFSRYARKRAA